MNHILRLLAITTLSSSIALADTTPSATQLRQSADEGDANAQIALAEAYHDGALGLKRSDAQAVLWYRKAAEQGDLRGEFNLAIAYYNGLGVKKDLDASMPWFLKAAEQGYPQAQYITAAIYQNGRGGLPKDLVQSHMWLSLAEKNGVKDAASERISLESQMKEDQIKQAKMLAENWKPRIP